MKKRSVIMVLLALLMVFVLVACGNGGDEDIEDPENGQTLGDDEDPENGQTLGDEEDLPVMTMDEVAENDGQDGSDAYVVIEGIVYDVTDNDAWNEGMHQGNEAGQDLTEVIMDAPHGTDVLEELEAVGRIEE